MRRAAIAVACLAGACQAKEEQEVIAQSLARLLVAGKPSHAFQSGSALGNRGSRKAASLPTVHERQGQAVMVDPLVGLGGGVAVGFLAGLAKSNPDPKKRAPLPWKQKTYNPYGDQRFGNYNNYGMWGKGEFKGNYRLEDFDPRLRITNQPGYQMFGATRSTWGLPGPLPFIKMKKRPHEVDPKTMLPGGVWDKRNLAGADIADKKAAIPPERRKDLNPNANGGFFLGEMKKKKWR